MVANTARFNAQMHDNLFPFSILRRQWRIRIRGDNVSGFPVDSIDPCPVNSIDLFRRSNVVESEFKCPVSIPTLVYSNNKIT